MKKGVYKFYWDCGRMGKLDGVFIATDDTIKIAIGKEVYFGEVLGKHSEIYGILDKGDVQLVSDDPVVVEIMEEHGLCSGYDPLEYIEEGE